MGDLSKNFSRAEFASKDGAKNCDTIDAGTLAIVQAVRDHFGRSVEILSGNRSAAHNARVGGAKDSQHLFGRAADIKVAGTAPGDVADWITANYPNASVGRYPTFTHVDTRTGGPVYWKG